MAEIKNILAKYRADIEQSIEHNLRQATPFIGGVIRYHFGWMDQNFEPANFESGKMIRPIVCLLVFEALTGGYKPALPAAAAIEMIHNFTLIHDDIEDDDRERRGRPTAWTVWGKPLTINVGDYLYTLAFKSLTHLDSTHFEPEKILLVQRLVIDACLALTQGQDLDLRFEQQQNVSTEMYIDMVYKKTGALLEAALLVGAHLGTSDRSIIENYQVFAKNIGIAFQVRDDILGIWGDAAETGKSVNNDLRRKKKTLPVIYTLNEITGPQRDMMHALYVTEEPLSDEQIEMVRDCLAATQAHAHAQNVVDVYIDRAFEALHRIGISNQAQTSLETIARFLIDRSR